MSPSGGCLGGRSRQIIFVNIKYDIFLSDDFPAHSRGWGLNFSFPSAEKKQNAAAASDAMKVSAKAGLVIAAPAKAEEA